MKKSLSTKTLVAIFGGIITCSVVVGTALLVHMNASGKENGPSSYIVDESAINWDESIVQEEVDPGSITIPGFDEIAISANKEQAEIALINPAENECYFEYEIILKDTNESIYRSELIEPGKAIVQENLLKTFDIGEYPVLIRVNTFNQDGSVEYNGADLEARLVAY